MASRLPQFYASVRQYYVNACTYMISKFPFHDPVLLNAEVANIGTRDQQSVKKLMFFVERYSCLLPPSATIDSLEEQFNNYQIASLPEAVKNAERIDEAWHEIGHIPDVATGLRKFGLLSSVVKGILVIFHSNADCERIFSVVNKKRLNFVPTFPQTHLGVC